jgi:hypothetical protein
VRYTSLGGELLVLLHRMGGKRGKTRGSRQDALWRGFLPILAEPPEQEGQHRELNMHMRRISAQAAEQRSKIARHRGGDEGRGVDVAGVAERRLVARRLPIDQRDAQASQRKLRRARRSRHARAKNDRIELTADHVHLPLLHGAIINTIVVEVDRKGGADERSFRDGRAGSLDHGREPVDRPGAGPGLRRARRGCGDSPRRRG